MPIRVLIVDDHAVVRQGLKMFLKADRDLHIVGEATNGEEAVRAAHEHQVQLSPAVAAQLMRQIKLPESPDALTERGTKFSNSSRAADRTRTLAGLAEMRALIMELRPESLKSEGLVNVLKRQADALRARHHLKVETDFCDEPALSFQAKEALYRIGQEAMHNAVKHARDALRRHARRRKRAATRDVHSCADTDAEIDWVSTRCLVLNEPAAGMIAPAIAHSTLG